MSTQASQPSRVQTIGVIGLGAMGAPMVHRLLAASRSVVVTGRSQKPALVDAGARWCGSPRELSAAAHAVLSMLPDLPELEAALDITLQRFAEFQGLEGAFGRRAVTERAKGILMERHKIDEQEAFELLRAQARSTGRKLVDVAEAVVEGYLLLPANRQ